MFTGIIEAVGEISQLHNNGSDIRLTVQCHDLDMTDVALGDSIATNGVCLTVVEFGDNYYCADVSQETIKYTGFSDYSTGAKVNLEKAMLPTSRFGGHIVSGHVDGVGHVTKIIDQQKYIEVWVHMPPEIRHYIAHKGSITVDGVSLTVNEITEDEFMLWLIPHTLEKTVISTFKVGTRVNLEVDVIARYLERLMQGGHGANNQAPQSDISMAFLAENGYLNRK